MIYVTEMLRFGSSESHHYIVGAYSTIELATLAGEVEKTWRGGNKYEYRVVPIALDAVLDPEKYHYHTDCCS